jgi:hypothetical protein
LRGGCLFWEVVKTNNHLSKQTTTSQNKQPPLKTSNHLSKQTTTSQNKQPPLKTNIHLSEVVVCFERWLLVLRGGCLFWEVVVCFERWLFVFICIGGNVAYRHCLKFLFLITQNLTLRWTLYQRLKFWHYKPFNKKTCPRVLINTVNSTRK